jgi:predicted deacylase
MEKKLVIGDTEAKPGEIAKGSLGAVELVDGSMTRIPLITVNGKHDGPVLTVVAGVHGPELTGIAALQSVIKRVDPASLKGALLGIPGANPLAIRSGTYTTPIDEVNLSGPWYLPPKGEDASITQRIARHINAAIEKADCVIDMHANPLPSMAFVLTDFRMCLDERTREETKKIATAFGATIIDWPLEQATSLRSICVKNGKPALTPELPGNIYMWEEIIEIGAIGIMNVMRAIKMIDGVPQKQQIDVIKGDLCYYGRLVAQRGGFMFVKKKVGQKIKKGETVIEIVDVYGDRVEEIKMPINGYCWAFTGGVAGTHAISEGDKLAYVFAERSEIRLSEER